MREAVNGVSAAASDDCGMGGVRSAAGEGAGTGGMACGLASADGAGGAGVAAAGEASAAPSPESIARAAAATGKYLNAPLDDATKAELGERYADFVFTPYAVVDVLRSHVGFATDVHALLGESWAAAYRAGALRAHGDQVTFPLAALRADGMTPIEASIQRQRADRANPEGKPWYLKFIDARMAVPQRAANVSEAGQDALATARAMAATDEYREGPVPLHVERQLAERYSDFVFTTFASFGVLRAHVPEADVPALLEESWLAARSVGALRYYEGKVVFPLNAAGEDGITPIEASIQPATKENAEGKPWFLCYVNCAPRQRLSAAGDKPSKHLERFAWLGAWDEFLAALADATLPESWDFEDGDGRGVRVAPSGCEETSDSRNREVRASLADAGLRVVSVPSQRRRFAILKSYICTTFYRLESEGKICIAADGSFAAFNTGLVNKRYDDIYACFEPNTPKWADEWAWKFAGFAAAGRRGLGKRLVELFNPLPRTASYFDRKDDLLFDLDKELIIDEDHVLVDNISRLPLDFLESELRGSSEAAEVVSAIRTATDIGEKKRLYDELGGIIGDDTRLFRRLRMGFMEAVDTAKKRVRWNFKTAIPSYYPRANAMSLLLPICLMDDNAADAALVVQLMPSGNYQGQTILTMRQAYMDARLICRPDSDWLTTSSRADASDDDEEE